MTGWTCLECGLRHIFATCADVIPFSQWSVMTPDQRAFAFLRANQESLQRRDLMLPDRRIHVEPREDMA